MRNLRRPHNERVSKRENKEPSDGPLVRARFGTEAASAGLGHASLDTTLIYAERSLETALEVAEAVG